MAKTTLVEPDLKAGSRLVRALDEMGWSPSAALWSYLPGEDLWRLIIALPRKPALRQQSAYRRVAEILESAALDHALSIDDIGLVQPDDQLLALMRSAVTTGPDLTGIRFSHRTIDNILVEDAYIYRLQPFTPSREPAAA